MKKLLLFLILFSCKCAISQTNFSQFFNAPLNVNPSNTGRFIGDYRIGGVCRNQPERLSSSSMYCFFTDVKILPDKLQNNDVMAIGISALGEKNIYTGLSNTNLSISASYFKSLNEDGTEKLAAGFQTEFAFKKISPPPLVFEDQLRSWMNSGYTGMNPFERKTFETNYIDLYVGLHYQKQFKLKDLLMVGLSVAHANSPTKNNGEVIFSLSPQFSFQFEFEKKIAKSNKLLFAFIANNLTNNKLLSDYYVSSIYQMQVNDSKYKFNAGCIYRKNLYYSNSIVTLLGLNYDYFTINFSYDIAFLKKSGYQRKGGFEAGIIFLGHKNIHDR